MCSFVLTWSGVTCQYGRYPILLIHCPRNVSKDIFSGFDNVSKDIFSRFDNVHASCVNLYIWGSYKSKHSCGAFKQHHRNRSFCGLYQTYIMIIYEVIEQG